jgi:hypothetical protein
LKVFQRFLYKNVMNLVKAFEDGNVNKFLNLTCVLKRP